MNRAQEEYDLLSEVNFLKSFCVVLGKWLNLDFPQMITNSMFLIFWMTWVETMGSDLQKCWTLTGAIVVRGNYALSMSDEVLNTLNHCKSGGQNSWSLLALTFFCLNSISVQYS